MAAGIFHKKCGMSAAFVSACVNRALNVRSCFRFCAGRGSWGVSTVPETFHARFPVSVKSLQFVSAFGRKSVGLRPISKGASTRREFRPPKKTEKNA